MKIGFVLDDSLDKTDGVQQYVLTLGQWLSNTGHEVHYITGQTNRTDISNIHSLSRNMGVRFNQNYMTTPLPASRRKIKQLLLEQHFDVLHVQMPYSPFLAGRVIKCAPKNTAIIGTFHILPYSRLESLATRLLSIILYGSRKRFDRVLSVSKPAAEFALSYFGQVSSVVPNAVDVRRFYRGKKIWQRSDGKLTIVYLGRLVERKGCMYLLMALRELKKQKALKDVHVIIAGKGPLLSSLQKFVRDNRLTKLVKFVGYVSEEDKPDILASADIAVLPSIGGESFGIVLVEAMAAGADVVIAGDNTGYRTVMTGHGDQLIDPTKTTEFADLLKEFISSKNARKSAKKWQAQRAKQYDVENVGKQILKVYQQALKSKFKMR
ncbi:glycosyltransferase family 4 protein [Candidatus Saccharibacteria bacterium]|nr:glycosyltransferase family 4 protein [Candidatus Saccharibacteria bacterium]